jgi:hypothetical protein
LGFRGLDVTALQPVSRIGIRIRIRIGAAFPYQLYFI